jgi:hypothetical protein
VIGIWNVAPWQPEAEVAFMDAPVGTCMTTLVIGPLATVMFKPVIVGTETPELPRVMLGHVPESLVQPAPPTTVTGPFWAIPVTVTEKLLGLFSCTRKSALLPGTSCEVAVPLVVATSVTCCVVPEMADPEPDPGEVKYA